MHPAQPPQQRPKPQWKTWHIVLVSTLGGLVVLILGVVALASALGGDDSTGTETATDTGIPEGFDDYLAELDAINPGIRADRPEQSVYNDADNTCADVEAGTEEDVLLDRTMQRYGVNEAEELVTEEVAQRILDVTREHCGTIRPE
jgi:hypothetical protein